MPSVFISYAHESDDHRQRVLDLARALLQAGWEVRLDRFAGYPTGGWPRWMADQIEAADRILCICTRTYCARFDGDQPKGGLGVSWEGYLLTGLLYRSRDRRKNVIPVWPTEKKHEGSEYLPLVLRPLAEAGLPFDLDTIVERLGNKGEARPEPPLGGGQEPCDHECARPMDPYRLLGSLFRPIRSRPGVQDPHDVPPSTFLRPEYAIVPFHGRERELEELGRWCHGDGVRLRLLHGSGGAGKTRLALELAACQAREGWRTGPLTRETHTEEQVRALVQDPIPLLVIIDYAETRLDDVTQLLRHHQLRGTSTMRVLLLARHKGDWVESLLGELPGVRDLWDNPLALLEALPVSVQKAAEAFAAYFTRPVPAALPPDHDTPLSSHIAALLAVRGLEGSTIDDLVDHEKRYLKNIAQTNGIELPVAQCLPDAMALITLAQGILMDDAPQWFKRVDGLGDLPEATKRSAKNLLFDLYPGSVDAIAPVLPDRVGEVYVAKVDRDGKLAQAAVDGGRAVQALTVLTRHAQKVTREDADKPLRRLLESQCANLAEAVVTVAIQTGDPVGQIAAQWLEGNPDPNWAERVNNRIPHQTTALRELAAVVARIRFKVCDEEEDLVQFLASLPKRAARLNNLGIRLSALGRDEDALELIRKAVAILRELAPIRPDDFQPRLAKSLNNYASILSALDRREEALEASREAVGIDRRLALAKPNAFLPNLAASLDNLGKQLSRLGLCKEALEASREAVEIYRPLAQARPDAFLPDLAGSLNNLGEMLSDLGHREEALAACREAAVIYRQLAQAQPDAFLPDLAMSLNNLGNRLSDLGHREEALEASREAAAIYRQLAQARPDAFLPDLASSLNNLGNRLSDLGHREEALEASRETVKIRRQLAQARPDAILPYLARSLGAHGTILLRSARPADAAATFGEALGIALTHTRKLPSAHRGLATALAKDYRSACQTAGLSPDPQLLAEARSLGIELS